MTHRVLRGHVCKGTSLLLKGTKVPLLVAVTSALLSAGCATNETSGPSPKPQKIAREEQEVLTGSRLPSKSIPRQVTVVSNAEMERERPPSGVGPRIE